MDQNELLELFQRTGAVKEGHFRLSSGLHSNRYFQMALLLQYPDLAARVATALAEKCAYLKPTVVVGPALGGVIIAHELGRALGVRAVFAERDGGHMNLRRGFSLGLEDRVLLAEDVVTTGGSVLEVKALVERLGAQTVGIAAIVDRSGGSAPFAVPFQALVSMEAPSYPPEQCPLCRAGGPPAVKPGSRPG